MKDLLSYLLLPVPFFLILAVTAFILGRKGHKRAGVFLICLAVLFFIIVSTRPFPLLLINNLETKYKVFSDSEIVNASTSLNIMVLAAGHVDDKSLQPNNQLSLAGLGRLTEGVRIYKLMNGSKLILSGPGGSPRLRQWEALRETAIFQGVNPDDIIIIDSAKSTADEARLYFRKFGVNNKFILVTSAVHMPRAVMLFRKEGLDPIPAPTNHIIKHGSRNVRYGWLPSSYNIQITEQAMHEWMGLVWAKVGGK